MDAITSGRLWPPAIGLAGAHAQDRYPCGSPDQRDSAFSPRATCQATAVLPVARWTESEHRWPALTHDVCNLLEQGSEVDVGQPSARRRLLSTPSPQPGKRRAAELKPEGWLLLWARAP